MNIRVHPCICLTHLLAQSEQSRLMLLIEWEYVRLYINSLALQAVAERESSQVVGMDGQAVRISEEDAVYIDHVVEASKSILNYMISEFAPRGYLRLSPVKVFLRIISAAVFLVKAISHLSTKLTIGTCFRPRHCRSQDILLLVRLYSSCPSQHLDR
jgi:hypothetical protein